MSVQVKTPTKNQFEHSEIHCGDRTFKAQDKVSLEGTSKVRDDIGNKNESKFSQPWNRKRRYSQSYHREESAARRKRLKSSPYCDRQLPTKFLNGGTIDDPLNLNGLDSSDLGKQLNSITPQSSPLPVPKRQSVELRIPLNVTDPLNLSGADEDGVDLEKLFKKKKQRHNRHKKKDDSSSTNFFSPPKNIAKDKNLMEALKIDIEPEPVPELREISSSSVSRDSVKPRQVSDKIVSPVVRQVSPKSKKRRRKSDNKVETLTSSSKSFQVSTESQISPSNRNHKKFKHPKLPKKHPTKEHSSHKQPPKFIYGNYNRYYGYRNPSMNSDQRMTCLNPDWFDGKVALDIGCNVGHLTLSIARDFHPSKIVGIDIDQKLIGAARKNIRYYMSNDNPDLKKFPISTVLNYGPIDAPPVLVKEKNAFPHNIMFMQGNYVLECDELLDMQTEEYDVVLAFSITKWIHFNWGDDGLKRFFKRVFKQLKPGGRFVLEPQPWSSYKKKKKLTPEIFQNFQKIRLRPEQFNDFLLSKEVGFSTCIKLEVPTHSSKGFCRPIMVYTKSDTVQNSPYPEMGNVTPVYSSYLSCVPGHLQPVVEVSESSCSSSDSSGQSVSKPSSTSASIDLDNSQKSHHSTNENNKNQDKTDGINAENESKEQYTEEEFDHGDMEMAEKDVSNETGTEHTLSVQKDDLNTDNVHKQTEGVLGQKYNDFSPSSKVLHQNIEKVDGESGEDIMDTQINEDVENKSVKNNGLKEKSNDLNEDKTINEDNKYANANENTISEQVQVQEVLEKEN